MTSCVYITQYYRIKNVLKFELKAALIGPLIVLRICFCNILKYKESGLSAHMHNILLITQP